MDVDKPFTFAPSSPALGSPAPQPSDPALTTFSFVAPAPFDARSKASLDASKSRSQQARAPPPDVKGRHQKCQVVLESEDNEQGSSPQSSPIARKLERTASSFVLTNQMRAVNVGPNKPLALGFPAHKKPTRPTLNTNILGATANSRQPRTAFPVLEATKDKENRKSFCPPPVRRAVSAMQTLDAFDQAPSSEGGCENDPDMSSPAQSYAKRHNSQAKQRRDGTLDFRPRAGASALMKRDADLLKPSASGSRRGGAQGAVADATIERDTPRSKYLSAAPSLGSFGDNEALGKILPCHRVCEDGLMRITPSTVRRYDPCTCSIYLKWPPCSSTSFSMASTMRR